MLNSILFVWIIVMELKYNFKYDKLRFLDDYFINNIGDLSMAARSVKLDQLPVDPTSLLDKEGNVLLEFILFTFYRTVVFGIIQQTNKFLYNRGTDITPEFYSSKCIMITSYHYPELRSNQVQLRGGGTSYDYDLCIMTMNNAKDAENYKERVLQSLIEWAAWLSNQPQEDVSTSSLES